MKHNTNPLTSHRFLTRYELFVALFLLFWIPAAVQAEDYTWHGPSGGVPDWWDHPDAWSVYGVPGSGDNAYISQGAVKVNAGTAYTFGYGAAAYQLYQINSHVFLSGGTLQSATPDNGIQYGTVAGTMNFKQTGGTVSTRSLWLADDILNPNAAINVHYEISRGVIDVSEGITLGAGGNASATLTISGSSNPASPNYTSVNAESINLGYYGNNGNTGHGTGTLEVHGGEVRANGIHGGGGGGDVNGTAYYTQTGGSVILTGTGEEYSTGYFGLGHHNGKAIVNISGGYLEADTLNLGLENGTVEFTLSGGTLKFNADHLIGAPHPYGNVWLGSMGGTVTMDMSGGSFSTDSKVHLGMGGANSTINLSGGNFEAGHLDIGEGEGMYASTGTVNISGGELNVAGTITGNSLSSLNIFGSRATNIQANHVEGDLALNFTLDAGGVSTLELVSIANAMTVTLNYSGFVAMTVDSTDVISTRIGLNQMIVINNTPFVQSDDGYTLSLNMNTLVSGKAVDTWNLMGSYDIFDSTNPGGKESGVLKVQGKYTAIQAVFSGLEGSLAQKLVDYLNASGGDTGVRFSLLDDTSLLLTGNYLNDQGYAWFGWDLSGFNSANGSNVGLLEFNEVPEPATWAMILLGGASLLVLRRRK